MIKILLSAAALAVLALFMITKDRSGTQVNQIEEGAHSGQSGPATPAEPAALEGEGKKNLLPDGRWFTWKFDKKPRLGTVIMKVRIYSGDNAQETGYEVSGDAGMPSMRHHDTGPVKFQLNKKGDYLLPVDVVMPGEWSVVIRIKRSGKEIFAGKVNFNV